MSLNELPEEIILVVFVQLRPEELCRLSCVCQLWYQLTFSNSLWKRFVLRKFSYIYKSDVRQEDWKKCFKNRVKIERRWRRGCSVETVFKGHQSTVFCIAPLDETHIISAGDDSSMKIWNVDSAVCELSVQAHQQGILGMAYDPLRNMAITGSYAGQIKFWKINIEARKELPKMSVRQLKELLDAKKVPYVDCLEKSDLVKRVLLSKSLPPVECLYSAHKHHGPVIGMYSLQNIVASCGADNIVRLWNKDNNINLIKELRVAGHGLNCVQLYDNCKKCLTGGNDHQILLWDIERGKVVTTARGHTGWVWALSYNEMTKMLVSTSVDSTIRVLDTSCKKAVAVITDHQYEVSGLWVDWIRDIVITASFGGEIKIHDMRNWKCLSTIAAHNDRCTRIFANYDNIYSASFDKHVRRWNFAHNFDNDT